MGGVGKTRLALQVASDLASERHFAEEMAFVDLASTRDSDLVIPAIAQALNVRVGQEAAESALKSLLRSRHLLLILDNFEQVGEAGAALIDLLHACPDLHILVTSRSLLNLTGERVMPVPPLRVGSGEIGESASRQLGKNDPSSEAVRLFVERTRAVNPGFALSAGNKPVIAEIVQRLDGLPLAIELAAARGALLSPSDLLARLAHPLPQLTAGPRDRPERHQTMHAAIAWSYALLTPEEQRVFRCLGVFAGGCTLEAAGMICAPVDESALDRAGTTVLAVESALESLVRQSLIRAAAPPNECPGDTSVRVIMLETIREFAVEQLAANGEEETVRDRHAAWYLGIVEELDLHHTMQGDIARMSQLAPEQDNLRQALAWFAARDDALCLNRLSAALAVFWFDLGQFAEARAWLRQAIARDDGVPVLTRARARSEAGWLAMCQGELALATSLRDEALALAREAGDPFLLADAILRNGILAFWQGELERASELIAEAQHAFLAIGAESAAPVKAAAAVNLLGGVALIAGDVPLAIRRGEEAVAMARALGAGADLGYALCGLGYARLQDGAVMEAAACFLEATALTWLIRDDVFLARLLWAMAAAAATGEQVDTAARLIGKADALDMRTGSAMWPNDRSLARRCLALLERSLPASRLSDLRRAGASLSVEEAVVAAQAVASLLLGAERAAAIWQATGAPDLGLGHAEIEPAVARVQLTPRELDVLHLLVDGRTDRDIAEHLFITRRTASKHVEAIFAKLGVRSRGAAVAEARRLGLAPVSPNDLES